MCLCSWHLGAGPGWILVSRAACTKRESGRSEIRRDPLSQNNNNQCMENRVKLPDLKLSLSVEVYLTSGCASITAMADSRVSKLL